MSNYPDASPNSKAKGKGGMKNNDGREGGSGWNSDKSKEKMSDKSVGVMPNEGLKELRKGSAKVIE